jgi:hypothetical protein
VDEGHIEWVEKDPLTDAADTIVKALAEKEA